MIQRVATNTVSSGRPHHWRHPQLSELRSKEAMPAVSTFYGRRGANPAGDFDYEVGGRGYVMQRRPDPRGAAHVHAELGNASTVIDVSAGAGSYEPEDRGRSSTGTCADNRTTLVLLA